MKKQVIGLIFGFVFLFLTLFFLVYHIEHAPTHEIISICKLPGGAEIIGSECIYQERDHNYFFWASFASLFLIIPSMLLALSDEKNENKKS